VERLIYSTALAMQRACCALKSDPTTCHDNMCTPNRSLGTCRLCWRQRNTQQLQDYQQWRSIWRSIGSSGPGSVEAWGGAKNLEPHPYSRRGKTRKTPPSLPDRVAHTLPFAILKNFSRQSTLSTHTSFYPSHILHRLQPSQWPTTTPR